MWRAKLACDLVILIGGDGTGESHLVKMLATISGQKLITISANNEMDTNDLLGGFEQKNIENDLRILQEDFKMFIFDNLSNFENCAQQNIWDLLNDTQNDNISNLENLEIMMKVLTLISNEMIEERKGKLLLRIEKMKNIYEDESEKMNGSFEWIDSKLFRAVQEGHWLLIDNANHLNASVLDRLNSFFLNIMELLSMEKVRIFIFFLMIFITYFSRL